MAKPTYAQYEDIIATGKVLDGAVTAYRQMFQLIESQIAIYIQMGLTREQAYNRISVADAEAYIAEIVPLKQAVKDAANNL